MCLLVLAFAFILHLCVDKNANLAPTNTFLFRKILFLDFSFSKLNYVRNEIYFFNK